MNSLNFSREDIIVSFEGNPVFYVNESKKTVACRLKSTMVLPEFGDFYGPNLDVVDRDIAVTGVARCQEGDVFDINRGKRIALTKAENETYKVASERIEKSLKSIKFLLDVSHNFIEKASHCIEHNKEYIDILSNVKNPDYIEEVYEPNKGMTVVHVPCKKTEE